MSFPYFTDDMKMNLFGPVRGYLKEYSGHPDFDLLQKQVSCQRCFYVQFKGNYLIQ